MTATDSSVANSYDALVVGGGPAGSTVATLLAQHGLRVAVFERARFPRFHIGESLLPANVPMFDRLGCHEALRRAGFLVKPGASFYDEYEGRGTNTFTFQPLPTMWCGPPLMIFSSTMLLGLDVRCIVNTLCGTRVLNPIKLWYR